MRRFALLALLLLAVPAQAQLLPATVDARFGALPATIDGNGTVVQEVTVGLAVAGFICDEDTTFQVPLQVVADNASVVAAFTPDALEFTVPAGTTLLTPFSQELQAALVVHATGAETTVLELIAGTPTGQCTAVGTVTQTGDDATLEITWPAGQVEDSSPGQIMPFGPAWAGVLMALALARRGPRDNAPK